MPIFVCVHMHILLYFPLLFTYLKTKFAMPSSNTKTHRGSPKQGPKQNHMSLPKVIHDELRMCVALRGHSTIRSRPGKILTKQYKHMEDFYHDKSNHLPTQIQMLVEVQLHHGALYEKKTVPIIC